jgi:hypothetical protein
MMVDASRANMRGTKNETAGFRADCRVCPSRYSCNTRMLAPGRPLRNTTTAVGHLRPRREFTASAFDQPARFRATIGIARPEKPNATRNHKVASEPPQSCSQKRVLQCRITSRIAIPGCGDI